jgi:hypothetical protein
MTNKMKLLDGLLVLGVILIGAGSWFLFNPVQRIKFAESTPITIKLPESPPMIYEKLEYIMHGEFDYLYIYPDGSIIYIEEKGLRMPTPEYPPTRIWKVGWLQEEELEQLIGLFQSNEFATLGEYYQFPGKPIEPIEGVPTGGFTVGDGSFSFSISYRELQKTISASGYLTPDHGETYPDMPFPLNELYVRLRVIVLERTEEIAQEKIR